MTPSPSTTCGCGWSDGKVLEQTYGGKPATTELSSLLPGMVKGLHRSDGWQPRAYGHSAGRRLPGRNATPSVKPGETLVLVVDLLFTQSQ